MSESITKRRRALIPLWIKIFIWLFIALSVATVLSVLANALLNIDIELYIYGLKSSDITAFMGLAIIIIFLFKGATALALWTGEQIAILLGIVDSIVGLVICCIMMIIPLINPNSGIEFRIRLEILFLIPFLIKMISISKEWNKVKNNYPQHAV